jgi:phosphopantetheine adenylyltransferase
MKKTLTFGLLILGLIGCTKDDLFINQEINQIKPELQIKNSVGLKLETAFVTGEVAMNVKSEVGQSVTIKIFDISNRVVSKETMTVKSGDNILKVYTSALPSSAYRIGLYDSKGNQLGITDFNKL